ncbi:hypothetical protein EBR43_05595 [bacterium]|nr:hypothetical protein [bacterium]
MRYAITKTYDTDSDNPYTNKVPSFNVIDLKNGLQIMDTFYTQDAAERYLSDIIDEARTTKQTV